MGGTALVPNVQSFMELLFYVRKIKQSNEYFEAQNLFFKG